MYKVLLVDDESHFRFAAKMVLKRAGFEVTDASNAKAALDVLQEHFNANMAYDLLIMDIVMPGMSGIDLIEALSKGNIQLPILIVSGIADREMIQELKRRGCCNILFKPFEPNQLIDRVNQVLASFNNITYA